MARKYSPASGRVSVRPAIDHPVDLTYSSFQMFSHNCTWLTARDAGRSISNEDRIISGGTLPTLSTRLVDVEIAPVGEIREQLHLAEIDRRGEADQVLHRPVVEDRAVQQRQHAAEAIADHVDVVLAGILLHAADAIRDEVEDIVLHPEAFFFRLRRGPVQHVDVVATLQEKLDKALARHQVEDVAAVGGRHHDQDRNAVDFIRDRAIVIEVHGAANGQNVLRRRAERWTR